MHYTTEAVVLRSREFGEADRLLTLYTLEQGKVTAKVRGARRPRTRLGGSTLALSHVEVMLWRGRSNIETLTQAVARDAWPPLRDDLRRLAHASLAAELVDMLTEEREPHPETFVMLLEAMSLIAYGEAPHLAAYSLALRLLRSAGLLAPLARCVACGAVVSEVGSRALWASRLAGLVCATCLAGEEQTLESMLAGSEPVVSSRAAGTSSLSAVGLQPLRADTLAVLGQLVDGTPRVLAALRPADEACRQLRLVLWDCMRANLDRPPHSLGLLDSMEASAPPPRMPGD